MTGDVDFVWETMKKLDYCMFVTMPGGRARARPMSSIVERESDAVYFLTDAGTAKDDEIEANPNVLLAYSNGASQFVSTAGSARLSTDRALIRRLWNPGAQAFWPDGPDNPDIVAIVVTPTQAEFWNGPSFIVGGAKMLFAALTGGKPDLGENRKVAL